jgi:alpha-N-arabinofuranosidase
MKGTGMASVFRNPVLSGFYPDPSICRSGEDFYLVNSTFAYFPGIPVFHSRDLVSWEQIGNAIHRPGQINFDGDGISRGLFAPSIRHHNGIFYILCTTVDRGGNFIITARNPAGPWSDPVWLKTAPGIDPSIFFDDDGKAWYTGTRPAPEGEAYPGNWEIWIQEIDLEIVNSSSGKNPLKGEARGIWRGALRDCIWPEGPHIYKKNSFYYLLHAEGGTGIDHAVCVARSKDLFGPWKGKAANPILTHRHLGRKAAIINVGHADLFDDTLGNWWMVLLASRQFYGKDSNDRGVCPLGRETFMVPVRWHEDWPYIASESGMVEWEFPVPDYPEKTETVFPVLPESTCDHFYYDDSCGNSAVNNGWKLPPAWLVLRMPQRGEDAAYSTAERPGYLRLFARAADMRGKDHPGFAGRRIQHRNWFFSASLEFLPEQDNECAGLVLIQSEDYQYRFEICRNADGGVINGADSSADSGGISLRIIRAAGKADETVAVLPCPGLVDAAKNSVSGKHTQKPLVLAVCSRDLVLTFYYGENQYTLKKIPVTADAGILSTECSGGFVGVLVGAFATGNGKDSLNYADLAWAEYSAL